VVNLPNKSVTTKLKSFVAIPVRAAGPNYDKHKKLHNRAVNAATSEMNSTKFSAPKAALKLVKRRSSGSGKKAQSRHSGI